MVRKENVARDNLLLECCQCYQQYEVPLVILARAYAEEKKPAPGWDMLCEKCGTYWFLPATRFQKVEISDHPLEEDTLTLKIDSPFLNEREDGDISPLGELPSYFQEPHHHRYQSSWRNKGMFYVLSMVLLSGIAWLGWQYTGGVSLKSYSLPFSFLSRQKTNLLIQNVRATFHRTDKQQEVFVTGEIVNPHSISSTIVPLRIKVWTPCDTHSTNLSEQEKRECVGAGWNYQWSRNYILPGERIAFQTTHSLPPTISIDRVEVTLP